MTKRPAGRNGGGNAVFDVNGGTVSKISSAMWAISSVWKSDEKLKVYEMTGWYKVKL